jgi:hypothetical protein
MKRLTFLALLAGIGLGLQADPIAFPAGFVPFTSIEYVTRALPNGDRLVLGNASLETLHELLSIPLPTEANQIFSNSQIELAPGEYFTQVYVPTPLDRIGAYPEFAGLLIDPVTGAPFPGGYIPTSKLFGYYAFRLAPGAITPTPEPGSFVLIAAGAALIFLTRLRCTR